MKRSPLHRTSSLSRSKPLRRAWMRRKPTRARTVAEGGDPARLRWIRQQDCASCGREGPSHAHHRTLSGRGKGQKSADDQAIPLCATCHAELHSLTGHFRGFTRANLDEWQCAWVEVLQGWYARLFAPASEVA